ncbi:MAG: alpha/beta fold hydrolase [Microlunatus sp.]
MHSTEALLTTDPPRPPIAAAAEPPFGNAGDRLRQLLAERSPDAGPVLSSPGRHLDAPQLLDLVESWSSLVRARVTAAGDWQSTDLLRRPVAMPVSADLDSIVAILAVIDSGHPLVVLDPLVPDSRRELVIGTADAVVVAPADLQAAEPPDPAQVPPRPDVAADDPAVIVFTSGSTGKPKAVVHSHAFWLNQITEARLAFDLTPSDRVAQVLPVSYGAGLDVLFMALLNGAALSYYDPRQLGLRGMIEWLTIERATTLHCTPALLRSLLADLPPAGSVPGSLRRDLALSGFRLVTTCGEQAFGGDVESLRQHTGPDTVFVNWSGSSETGHLAFFRIGPDDQVPSGPLPAGVPAANKLVRIRRADGSAADEGEPGGLAVESRYLFSGYLADPELTASKITAGPDGYRAFSMGDRAQLTDGVLQLLGRDDAAVKIRGYLVEPSEVEAALRSVDGVADAAVVVISAPRAEPAGAGYAPPEMRLAAYVSLDPNRPTLSTAGLRGALRDRLPDWMQPQTITLVAELPRNERGKIDRDALPAPTVRTGADLEAPQGSTERQLAALWARLAGIPTVGREQTLVELGADSLIVEQMLATAEELFGVDLLTSDLTEHASVAAFARLIEDRVRGRSPVSDTGLSLLRPADDDPAPRDPTVFCLAGAGGHGSLFAHLAGLLDVTGPVYAIQARGLEGGGRPELSVAAMVRRILALITETAPDGPLALVGHSLGGLLATEVGTRLTEQGRTVVLVAALDSVLPAKAVPPSARPGRSVGPARTPAPSKKPAGLWRSRAQVARVALGHRYPIGVHKQVHYELAARVSKSYRPVPFTGPGVVITIQENTDQPHWWDQILPDRRTMTLPCDHLGVLKPPYVQQTAALINDVLTSMSTTTGTP